MCDQSTSPAVAAYVLIRAATMTSLGKPQGFPNSDLCVLSNTSSRCVFYQLRRVAIHVCVCIVDRFWASTVKFMSKIHEYM